MGWGITWDKSVTVCFDLKIFTFKRGVIIIPVWTINRLEENNLESNDKLSN